MRLCRLEMQGFKSFADKTVLEFEQGITAVVGPNGVGKSNIADAIKWVLGEPNAKELRGGRLEDVIFAGTVTRPPLGMAEVSLTFDNSDGLLPVSFSEVTVTRRVFRSGETECRINKALCRLKDIQDLFRDTGLGRDSLALIGQNKVDAILNDPVQERRGVFEEAAGITRFRQRKREALRKLAETEQNIIRLTDIVAELTQQLGPLQEKATKARAFQQLEQRRRACQVAKVLRQLAAERAKLAQNEARRDTCLRQETMLQNDLAQQETALTQGQLALLQLDECCRVTGEKIQIAEKTWQQAAAQLAVVETKAEQSQAAAQKAQREQASLQQQRQELAAQLAAQATHLADLTAQEQELHTTLTEREEAWQSLSMQVATARQALAAQRDAIMENLESVTASRHELRAVERELALGRERAQQLQREQSTLAQEFACASQVLQEKQARHKSLQEQLSLQRQNAQAQEQELQGIKEQLHRLRQQEREMLAQANQLTARHNMLKAMQQSYEGFGNGVKCVLQCQQAWRNRIYGAVAEIISVSPAYATAVATALGGAMQYIVSADENAAQQAIAYLHQKKAGRATFLPLTTIRPLPPREREQVAAALPGSHGFAAALVTAPPRFQTVVQFLLGRIIVAQDMAAALAIAKQTHFAVKVVTLAGDVVNAGGSLTGGSHGRREDAFWGRARELARCAQDLAAVQAQLTEKQQQIADMERKYDRLSAAHERLRQDVQQAQIACAATVQEEENVRQNLARLRTTLDVLARDAAAQREQEQTLQQRHQELTERLQSLEGQEQRCQENVKQQQAQLEQWEHELAAQQEELTRLKVQAAALAQNVTALRQTREELARRQEAVDAAIASSAMEEAALARTREALAADRDRLTRRQQELGQELHRLRQEQARQQREREEKRQDIDKQERAVRELRRQSQEAARQRQELELAITQNRMTVEGWLAHLRDVYQLTLDEAQQVAGGDFTEDLETEIATLTRQIEALGPVNVGAIEEYETVARRHDFIVTQLNDLTAAQQRLGKVIAEIDTAMTRRLTAAFDQIKVYFNEIFRRLFGGGQADLRFTTPEQVLDSGVEILVQPPGKKRQNLTILSGGERVLTVIALLFALLRYRPAPLCVFDEIDASLDEANIMRFRDFLREFAAAQVQFITITHRKGTMEAADVLYGVTMPDNGVSRIVSVKIMGKAG